MKRSVLILVLGLLAGVRAPAATAPAAAQARGPCYRLEFTIRGGAISRVLFLFPLRIFYDASAAVDLETVRGQDGSLQFSFAGLPRPAYVLRTLGFGGKTLALLTVDAGDGADGPFRAALIGQWRRQFPEFASRIGVVKTFPHFLRQAGAAPFSFRRDAAGAYRDILCGLEPAYRHAPAHTGLYFNVFPLLADLLTLLNQRALPPGSASGHEGLADAWSGGEIDLSVDLNRIAGLLEKVVQSMVTVRQKGRFRLQYRASAAAGGGWDICGEAFPDIPVWKGFMIREMQRRLRLDAEGLLQADEIWLGLRGRNGQGGWGRLRLSQWDETRRWSDE